MKAGFWLPVGFHAGSILFVFVVYVVLLLVAAEGDLIGSYGV